MSERELLVRRMKDLQILIEAAQEDGNDSEATRLAMEKFELAKKAWEMPNHNNE